MGDLTTKREILRSLGGNPLLNDGILNVYAYEWLQRIENDYPELEAEFEALEPTRMPIAMDDVYAWLMKTSPGSPVMEQMLAEGQDPQLAAYLYQSKDVNEERALAMIEEREKRIAKLRRQGPENL